MIDGQDTEDEALAHGLIQALLDIAGGRSAHRANHAKGIVVSGTFTATDAALEFSRAPHFSGGKVPVTVRFSNFSGLPNIADGDANAGPRGLAIRFHLLDGCVTDIVCHSFNGFPTGDGREFLEFLRAAAKSEADAAAFEAFLEAHPRAMHFVMAPKPVPQSFATEIYYSPNALRFISVSGGVSCGRYRIAPVAGIEHLTDAEALLRPADFLQDELRSRLCKDTVEFDLLLQIAAADDPANDASLVWPETRRIVALGRLSLSEIAEDSGALDRQLDFDPANLVDGIALSDDPMISLRSRAYAIARQFRSKRA